MASISIDPENRFIKLVCGAGETNVAFSASDIYAAWKDWFLASDNSKYEPAMDSGGGDPVGGGEYLGAAFFLLASNGWAVAPETAENTVGITITGNLFPSPATEPLFDTSLVSGNVFIERRTSTLPTILETGVSGLTAGESTQLARLDVAVSSRLAAADYTAPPTAEEIAAEVGDPLATVVEAGLDARALLRIMAAVAAGAYTVDPDTGEHVFTGLDGVTARITGTVNPSTGARSASDLDGA